MMKRSTSSLLLALALAALAPAALAGAQHGEEAAHEAAPSADAHGGGHGEALTFEGLLHNEHITELYGSVFNFLILFGIFVWVIKTKVNPQLAKKREDMQEAMAEAARLKAEAEAKQREFQSRLERLDDELDAIRTDMVKAGEAERDRIVAEAEKKASRIRKDADFVIAQRFKQLREDLTKEAVESAMVAAEAVLREKATPADQTRLADVYLARLNEVAAEGAAQEKQA
ncbi:MAG: ATP synthase F0 subunit B [Sandaracinaceae bacterium]|jgi:F-type H+-transporting ATPase subunit b|nr:ATP synthase F0 subunit B [Sandaracinaceae bacterium]